MGNTKIKDENYFVVQGFMINSLQLKGTALLIYAIIYGFSQDGETEFTGSRQYLADFTATTRPTVDAALKELCEKGYITKATKIINGVTFNSYKICLDAIQGVKKPYTPCKETLHNNIDINKTKNMKERKNAICYDDIINNSIRNENVKNTLFEFVKMRLLIKKPLTDRALEMLIRKLEQLSNGNDDNALKILEQSIINSWQDIYEVKPRVQEPPKKEATQFGVIL